MKPLAIILAAGLTGCAAPTYTALDVSKRINKGSVAVTWVTVDDIDAFCRALDATGKSNGRIILACSSPAVAGPCVVYTGKQFTHDDLGHEVRHCFEGSFHSY